MKPFNLEEAMAGNPVQTRDGIEVTQLTFFDDPRLTYSVFAMVGDSLLKFTKSGRFYYGDGISSYDLFMAEEKKTIWINIWKNKVGYIFSTTHLREDRADIEIEEELEHTHLKKITTEL